MKTIHTLLLACLAFLAGSVLAQPVKVTATFTSGSGSAYAANDGVGALQTLSNIANYTGEFAELDSFVVVDSAAQAKAFRLLFFESSGPTITDNAAFSWGSSIDTFVGFVDVEASDYTTLDSKAIATRDLLAKKFAIPNSKRLYVAMVTLGTPTYGNGGTVRIDFYFKR